VKRSAAPGYPAEKNSRARFSGRQILSPAKAGWSIKWNRKPGVTVPFARFTLG